MGFDGISYISHRSGPGRVWEKENSHCETQHKMIDTKGFFQAREPEQSGWGSGFIMLFSFACLALGSRHLQGVPVLNALGVGSFAYTVAIVGMMVLLSVTGRWGRFDIVRDGPL